MKKSTLLLTACLLNLVVLSQSIKKDYYDYRKTQIMAEYHVNSVGEKHGWFKGYDQQGVLVYEYNYKSNLQDGVNKEYTTYTGNRKLAQSETYKAGNLDGPAIYYAENKGGGGSRIMSQGSYSHGEKQGKWTYTNPFDAYGMPEEWKSKAQYIQFEKYYEMGKEVYPNSEIISYYLPSKQPSTIVSYKDGKETGETKGFFPDGSIASIRKFDENGKRIIEKAYHPNGKLKASSDWSSGKLVYEGYDENGNPDKTMQYNQQEIEKENAQVAISKANSLLNSDKVLDAIKSYQELGYNTLYLESFLDLDKEYKNGTINLDKMRSQLKTTYWDLIEKRGIQTLKAHESYCLNYIERMKVDEKNTELKKDSINKEVQMIINSYKDLNVKQVQTMMVDANGKPIMKDTYLKSKDIYLKSMVVIDSYIVAYNSEKSLEGKKNVSQKIKETCSTLNQIPESEWKDLSKELKKIDDPEQIKTILKI